MAGRRRAAMSVMTSTPEGARRLLKRGLILFSIGLVITVGTYAYAASSSSGGTYIVSFGPMIFGAIYIIQGGLAVLRHRNAPPVWNGAPPAGGYGAPGYGAPGYGAPGYGAPGCGAPGYGGGDFGSATQPGYGQAQPGVQPAAAAGAGAAAGAAQAGWYPDPGGSAGLRYYDGQAWTEHLQQG